MKKIIILTVIFLCFIFSNVVYAQNIENKMPQIKFMGSKYTLYYSAKSPELGGYINEYYKQREGYTNWTELLALHHYPNAFYPIELAQAFKNYLNEKGVSANIETGEEGNFAVLDFVIINNNKLPVVLEFNVFKYVKSPICGTVALQYAKRYLLSNGLEAEMVKKEFAKTRQKYIKKVKKIQIPDIVTSGIENGVYTEPLKIEENKYQQEFLTEQEKEFLNPEKFGRFKSEELKNEKVKSSEFITKQEKEFLNPEEFERFKSEELKNEEVKSSEFVTKQEQEFFEQKQFKCEEKIKIQSEGVQEQTK